MCKTTDALTPHAKEATPTTAKYNRSFYDLLDFQDKTEIEYSERGLLAAPDSLELKDEDGKVMWSQDAYEFIEHECPDCANPSLWRNTAMNHAYGLFEVREGIYQVRGYDLTNLTVVRGKTGWILFDPMLSVECAQAALALIDQHLGKLPLKAIIISHTHADHYGGIRGVVDEKDVADASLSIEEQLASGKIPIIVPQYFAEYAISENVHCLNVMTRRASYQYGTMLDKGGKGSLGLGIGLKQSLGTVSYIPPTYEITQTGETLHIDGVELVFQMTPGAEAPAEMNTYFPSMKALWLAENCTSTLHNLYTLRGAQVRDGNAWAKYIGEAMTLYGHEAEVVFQSHNWPHWGKDVIQKYMLNTAAIYKFINDQTLMYVNQGYTMTEISKMIALPDNLAKVWYTRQYYGTLSHNSKAVYQKYMGWYDANPVHLNELDPTSKAKKFVEYLGSPEAVLEKAKEDYAKGEYQWVSEITNILVFDDPENKEARLLCADAMEQLGYQSESGPWRNVYLSGAFELRNGTIRNEKKRSKVGMDLLSGMTTEMMFEYMGIVIDALKAQNEDMVINFKIGEKQENFAIYLYNGVLLYFKDTQLPNPTAVVTCPKQALFLIIAKQTELFEHTMRIEGNKEAVLRLSSLMQEFDFFFNIIEP